MSHPEEVWAVRHLAGFTLELGCGGNPTPGVHVAVDQHERGALGTDGNQLGVESAANLAAYMDELPFRNGVFDTLVARHLLEHHADTLRVLREWVRVARRLVIVCPDQEHYDGNTVRLDPTHRATFTSRQLYHLLEHAGLRVRRVEYPVENWSFGLVAEV